MTNEELAKRDYVIAIDKSGSMSTADCPGGKTRWAYVQEQAENVARKCGEFDTDGIDIVVFAGTPKEYHGVTADKVHQVFGENSPGGSTDTAAAVKLVTDAYFARKAAGSAKPITLLVFTDGVPNDEKALAKVITDAANKIDADEEIGISFLQVGKDEHARAYLKSLDDDLQSHGAKFDIVDTKDDSEMENITVEELLIEAITD